MTIREEINGKILSTRSDRIKNQLRKKYAEKDREVKKSITDKREWIENITRKAEEAAINQHMSTLTKTICNERPRSSTAVLDKDGKLVSGKDGIQARWTEHFKETVL